MNIKRLVARNIADGTGNTLYPGRIIVKNSRIAAVEKGLFLPEEGDLFFDENHLIAPGFIDAHGHSDISLAAMPDAAGKTAQGIAFEISGNCGLSPFPLTEHNYEHLCTLYRQYKVGLNWKNYTSYITCLRSLQPALELFPLVGHNTLRAAAAGYEKERLSTEELQTMLDCLENELQAGALGLSFGLLYVPGCFADCNEIIALMKIVARHNKLCTVHLKSEGDLLEESLQEMIDCACGAGLQKLHLSHLKTAGESNFHKIDALLNALSCKDLCITGDCYCYNASMTQLSVIMPRDFDKYDDIKIMEILQDKVAYQQALRGLQNERPPGYWQKVRIVSAPAEYSCFNGVLLAEAAEKLHIASEELYLEIIRKDAPGAVGAFHTLSQKNMELLAAHPRVVPGSDESARSLTTAFGSSHPRGFGNHAEYFALRRKQGADLCTVIKEMTSIPASIFNLPDAGTIKPGARAVFTCLDPEKYQSRATFAAPHQLAAGAELIRL